MSSLGVYIGNEPAALKQYETWLGGQTGYVQLHTGRANWSDYVTSANWLVNKWAPTHETTHWTVPLFANGGSLSAAAKGAYDRYYHDVAVSLAKSNPGASSIYVRTGEEFNGNWMPWAAAGKEGDFVSAYRHFVTAFEKVSTKFKFEWNVNVADGGMNPAKAYPGDKYVDVIGMDFYYDTKWHPKDPVAAWNFMVNQKYGLQWHQDFANAHHKPTAYSEWGVMSDTAGPYIARASDWFANHHVQYQTYWNSNSAFPGKLSDNHLPHAGSTYKAEFKPSQGTLAWTATGTSPAAEMPQAKAVSIQPQKGEFDFSFLAHQETNSERGSGVAPAAAVQHGTGDWGRLESQIHTGHDAAPSHGGAWQNAAGHHDPAWAHGHHDGLWA